ncbi:MAG: YceH family protein [Limisphaerales bacterium]
MALELTPVETRILGCLIEKERLTPENYPLSLHALTAACNQSTSRDPVVSWDEKTVEEAIFSLRQKKLATLIMVAGARVQKFRHHFLDHYQLSPGEMALLCTLLLRGPQTPGELRGRSERMHAFATVADVEARLAELAEDENPLVRVLPPRPGQKEKRYVQLLSGEPDLTEPPVTDSASFGAGVPIKSRVEALETEVAALKAEIAAVREEFASFRKQFE